MYQRLEKSRDKSGENLEEELHTLVTVSLSSAAVCYFQICLRAAVPNLHHLGTVALGGGYH
jgi:hypothetical protein